MPEGFTCMSTVEPTMLITPEPLWRLAQLGLFDPEARAQFQPAFDRLTSLAARLLRMPVALVTVLDTDRQIFVSQVGLPEPWATLGETPLSHSFCQHTAAGQTPLLVTDARVHPYLYDNLAIRDLGVVAYAGIPLVMGDGYPLGSFCVIDHQPHAWTADEVAILSELAAAAMDEIALRCELSERRHAEIVLRESQRHLQTSLDELRDVYGRVSNLEQLKSDMIGLAAHDLRGPLLSMIGFTELMMEDRAQLPAEYVPFVEMIHRSGETMMHIIDDVLCLQRIEESGDFATMGLVSLNPLVAEAAGYYGQVAEGKNQRFKLLLPASPLVVRGDPTQLREAIHNLIGNAIKYTPEGGRITVVLGQDADHRVSFQVEDSGVGIPQEAQAELFKPFYRVRTLETAGIDGTGLGLALVKRIVERHMGRVHFTSRERVGSTFGFSLPRAIADRARTSA